MVIGTLVGIGVTQVHRDRRRTAGEGEEMPAYYPNCGALNDPGETRCHEYHAEL